MLTLFLILLAIAAILLILIILAQNPKGGGLSSSFGGSTQIIGARQTADFLEKTSWYLAIGILVVVLMTSIFKPSTENKAERKSLISDQVNEMAAPNPQNPDKQAQQTQQQQQQQQPQQSNQQQQQKSQSLPKPTK